MIFDDAELKRRYLLRIAGVRDKKVYIGPEIFNFDLTNVCNLSCKYCSAVHAPGNPHHFEKARFFSWERFLDIIRDAVELKVDQVHFSGPGEPSMHPSFRDMMRHLEHLPLYAKIFTNGTFPPEFCTDVIRADNVVINLSSVDEQQYRELQGKDVFDRVVANIKRLVALRDSGKPGFKVEIVYIVNSANMDQKQKIQDLGAQLGVDRAYFQVMHENMYNKEITLPDGSIDGVEKRSPEACLNGWFYTGVNLSGRASPCCWVHNMPLCDFENISFKEFWQSPQLMNVRLLGKHGQIQKMFKVCQSCPLYDRNIQRSQILERMKSGEEFSDLILNESKVAE